MIKYFYVFLLLANSSVLIGQKNHFAIELNADISRTIFENEILDFYQRNSLSNSQYFLLTDTYKSVKNNSYKFIYNRSINEKSKFGASFRFVTFGQKSDFETKVTYTSDGLQKEIFSYLLELKSSEFSLSYSYSVIELESISIEIKLSPTINLYHSKKDLVIFQSQDSSLFQQNNIQNNFFRLSNSNYFTTASELLQDKLFRIGSLLSVHVQHDFFLSWIKPYMNLEYGIYSRVLSDNQTFLAFSPEGVIRNFSVGLGLAINF